jgi:1,3-beta-glucan synthase component
MRLSVAVLNTASYVCAAHYTQELGFVTATQRVLDEPLSMRFHYGHPDVFDKTTAITMGGISRPRRVTNTIYTTTVGSCYESLQCAAYSALQGLS